MLLRITNGSTTITIHTNAGSPTLGLAGAEYFPSEGDGVTVSESIDIRLAGVSDLAIEALSTIRRLINEAPVKEVYLEYALVNGFTVYRSRVRSGALIGSSNPVWRDFAPSHMTGEAILTITRDDFWEGPEDTLIELATRNNGTASPYNVVTMAAPAGNLPTPLTVRLESINGSPIHSPVIYLNTDTFAGLTTNQHFVTPASGSASWGAGVDHDQLLWICTIPAATIAKLAGKEVSVLAAFSSIPTNFYVRSNLYSLYEGVYQRVAVGSERYANGIKLQNLGTLPIPAAANGGLVLVLSGYSALAGSATLSFCQLAPATGAVKLDVTHEWEPHEWVVYEGRRDLAYYDSGLAQYSNVRKAGGRLMAWPGQTNRLHVLFGESYDFVASRQTMIEIVARPRRSTI